MSSRSCVKSGELYPAVSSRSRDVLNGAESERVSSVCLNRPPVTHREALPYADPDMSNDQHRTPRVGTT